ncbi:hypothetical protein PG593_08615 [Riemerella anatipestifer]|uniref:hypothetical protein n=1 Tax=Riemerella anatipestifer TaxID=34085 RepID=UPI0013749913|nr:hypothetical protein [Riemerella anatipestifer]MDY3529836.1 hypothetical protein [Riemerella anatipestifer]
MNRILVLFIFLCCFLAACSDKKNKIIGIYKIDKYDILYDNNVKDYQYLELKSDEIFNLFYTETESSENIQGRWKILGETKDNGVLVQFQYDERVIVGILRGNIFYFTGANDFHNGKYRNILYVKTSKKR